MNKVKIISGPSRPNYGSIFVDDDFNLYILARVGLKKFVAVSLSDGNRWIGEGDSLEKVTVGLTFVCSSAGITVKKLS